MADKVSLSVQLVNDSREAINLPVDQPVGDLIRVFLNRIEGGAAVHESQVVVFVGKIIDPAQTLAQLEVQTGDELHLMVMRNVATQTRLALYLPQTQQVWHEVNHSPAVLGRNDAALGKDQPDLDVTSLLPRGKEAKVSRQQAIFTEKEGRWYIQAHPRANAPVSVNATRLTGGREVLLNENDVILLGLGDDNQPIIRLVVRLDS